MLGNESLSQEPKAKRRLSGIESHDGPSFALFHFDSHLLNSVPRDFGNGMSFSQYSNPSKLLTISLLLELSSIDGMRCNNLLACLPSSANQLTI